LAPAGPPQVHTDGGRQGYTFDGPTRFDKLFTGIAAETPAYIDLNDHSGRENITPAGNSSQITAACWRQLNEVNRLPRPAGFELARDRPTACHGMN
jgi:hypothetical protein